MAGSADVEAVDSNQGHQMNDSTKMTPMMKALLDGDDLAFQLETAQNRIVTLKQEIAKPTPIKRRSNFDRKGCPRVLFRSMQKDLNRGQTQAERQRESERDRNLLHSLNELVVELRGRVAFRDAELDKAAAQVRADNEKHRPSKKNGPAETPHREWKNEVARKAKR